MFLHLPFLSKTVFGGNMRIVNLPEEFIDTYKIISKRFESIDASVEFVFSDEMEAGWNGESGYIKCNSKSRLARLISVFAMLYRKGCPFGQLFCFCQLCAYACSYH